MEPKQHKISVIVPVYNKEQYLERGVRSLTAQTWRNLEILLIDDGSRDRSGEICDRLALSDERIRVIHKENEGLVRTWMRGVSEASGEYLNFMDSDDWVEPEMLEDMAGRLTGVGKEIVACDYVIEKSGGRQQVVRQKLPPGEYSGERLKKEVRPYLLGEEERYLFASRCMKLFSRQLIRDNLTFCDPKVGMGEDMPITLPAILDCDRLVVLDARPTTIICMWKPPWCTAMTGRFLKICSVCGASLTGSCGRSTARRSSRRCEGAPIRNISCFFCWC